MSGNLRGARMLVVCIGVFCVAALVLSVACPVAAAAAKKADTPAKEQKPDKAVKPVVPSAAKSGAKSESKPVAASAEKADSGVLPGWKVADGVQVKTIPVPEALKGKAETAYRVTLPPVTGMTNVLTQIVNKPVKAGQTATASVYLWAEQEIPLAGRLVIQVARQDSGKAELTNMAPPSLEKKPKEYQTSLTFAEAHKAIRMVMAFNSDKPLTFDMAGAAVVISEKSATQK